jgi:hypothetical protein
MRYLSQLLAQSEFYADYHEIWDDKKSFNEQLTTAKTELLKDIPSDIKNRLDSLYKEKPDLLYEIYDGAQVLGRLEECPLKKNADYISSYMKGLTL